MRFLNSQKKSITKSKWFWIIIVIVAFAALGNFLGLYEDAEAPVDNPVVQAPTEEPSNNSDETKKEKLADSVDALIDKDLKGDGYFCEILTLTDGGYRVDIQLPANKDKPESTKIIDKVLEDVKNLQNDDIKEIKISILNQMKIVDEKWWPMDE